MQAGFQFGIWCDHIEDKYYLNFGEEGGRSVEPFEEVVSFITHRGDYKLPACYKLILEPLFGQFYG